MWYHIQKEFIERLGDLKMVTALDVANTFLERGKTDNVIITPMKIQKLLYIFYKEYLKETRTKVFEERFETWQYGPVIQEVYDAFKKFRANPINDFYYYNNNHYRTVILEKGSDFLRIFDKVWEQYGNLSGIYLSSLTHLPDTAWSKADEANRNYLDDNDIILEATYDV